MLIPEKDAVVVDVAAVGVAVVGVAVGEAGMLENPARAQIRNEGVRRDQNVKDELEIV